MSWNSREAQYLRAFRVIHSPKSQSLQLQPMSREKAISAGYKTQLKNEKFVLGETRETLKNKDLQTRFFVQFPITRSSWRKKPPVVIHKADQPKI